MTRAEFDLKKDLCEIVSEQWLESEGIVKAVAFLGPESRPENTWLGLKAPTLDGNELWFVEKNKTSELELKMGFKKPLEKYFEVSPDQAKSLFVRGL